MSLWEVTTPKGSKYEIEADGHQNSPDGEFFYIDVEIDSDNIYMKEIRVIPYTDFKSIRLI